jgi:NADH-quinone oxidoreductase subunit N
MVGKINMNYIMHLFSGFMPEIFLSFSILYLMVASALYAAKNKDRGYTVTNIQLFQSYIKLLLALLLAINSECNIQILDYLFVNDISGRLLKIIIIFFSIILLNPLREASEFQKIKFADMLIMYLLAILSILVLISSANLLSIYMALEMQALCFYVFVASNKESTASQDAALKYFILGSFASVVFLIGCSLMYSFFGTTSLVDYNSFFNDSSIYSSLFSKEPTSYFSVICGQILVFSAFSFKLGLAPFHFWSVDVYEGSSLFATLIISLLPKLVIINLVMKFALCFDLFFENYLWVVGYFGALTAFIGGIFAIRQSGLKRFLIYSSMGQLGFALASLAETTAPEVFATVYFYVIVYIITSIVSWYVVIFYTKYHCLVKNSENNRGDYDLSSLNLFQDLYKINPTLALSIVVIFFSLAGIPVFIGFLIKFFVVQSIAFESKEVFAFILLIVSNAIPGFYYIRFIKISMYESQALKINNDPRFGIFPHQSNSSASMTLFCLLTTMLMYLTFNPTLLNLLCQQMVVGSIFY